MTSPDDVRHYVRTFVVPGLLAVAADASVINQVEPVEDPSPEGAGVRNR